MTAPTVPPAAFIEAGGFAYGTLPPDAARVARTAADAIRTVRSGIVQEIGTHLLRVKAALPHGAFTAWAEAELGITARTARNYMQAATFLDGKAETVSVLPPTVLYALAAPSAPAAVVQSVLTAAAAGEPLDPPAITRQLEHAKRADAELKVAQRRKPGLTRAELDARKAKADRQRQTAEDRAAAEQAQRERDTLARLRPLADAIVSSPGDLAARLAPVLAHRGDREALRTLLDAAMREAAR